MTEKLFQHPWWLKALSLVFAIMLWAYVMPSYVKETSKTFNDVPLVVMPHPTYELYEQDSLPQTVQIRAEGTGSVLNGLTEEELVAELDLSQVTEPGKPTNVQVQVRGPGRVTYVVFPRTVQVVLIEQSSQTFPVTVEPAIGTVTLEGKEYRYTATADVTEVSLGGRSDFLMQVKQVQIRLDTAELQPANDSITKTVTPLDAAGKEVPALTRPQVLVHLTWEELPPGKFFTVEPVTTGTLPTGLTVTGIQVEPATVSVRAQQVGGTLPGLGVIETAPIDLTGRTRTFTTSVRLVPPEGTNAALESVSVRVTIEEAMVDRVFNAVPLAITAPTANLDFVLSTREVSIRVRGPYSAVADLDASNLRAEVDLSGVAAGSHTLPVKVTMPPGATEALVDPAVVAVTLTPQ